MLTDYQNKESTWKKTNSQSYSSRKNKIMKNMLKAKKIPDDYHTLDRAGQVALICLCTGHNRLNLHMHRRVNLVPSPLCTCGTEDQTTEHILKRCPSSQRTDMVRQNIIAPEDIWLHSFSWLICVIKQMRRRLYRNIKSYFTTHVVDVRKGIRS